MSSLFPTWGLITRPAQADDTCFDILFAWPGRVRGDRMDAKDERIAALEAEVGRLKQEISHLKKHDEKKPGKAQGPKSFWLDFIAGGISGAIA